MTHYKLIPLLTLFILFVGEAHSFATALSFVQCPKNQKLCVPRIGRIHRFSSVLFSTNENQEMDEKFGGYTAKQRLREEVESPFRKVRFFFFISTMGSALTALYFSALSALKANMGGFADTPPLEESLNSCAINLSGAVVCAFLALREYRAGQANLERIAKGGALAKLMVSPGSDSEKGFKTMADYRRAYRVLICAGGKDYIEKMCLSLNSDQLTDENNIPDLLAQVDMLVVPVLLNDIKTVGDSRTCWRKTEPTDDDRNFDSTRSDDVVMFPRGFSNWGDYLNSEIETATKQGFDVLEKGITITIKKNGKVLRRATGAPRWSDLIQTMDIMDGSKFGMPGDSEKYGQP